MKMHELIFGEEFKASRRINLKYFNTLDTGKKHSSSILDCVSFFSPHSGKIIGEKNLIHFLEIDTSKILCGSWAQKSFCVAHFLITGNRLH